MIAVEGAASRRKNMAGVPDPSGLTATGLASLEMAPVGARLAGRYRLDGVLGAGGMGVVYRAYDEQLATPVALKALRSERRLDEAAIERFRQEIVTARKVTHPRVVRIHDIGRDGDSVFLTMDLVPGVTLRERLADGPLDVSTALRIAGDVAEGLAAAHDCGVVHRDVKPANVLIGADGGAFLTDFGVARAIGSDGLTAEGVIAGTPDYLSPEQIRGDAADGRSDIYALGLVLHEMLTGETPLRGDSIAETVARRVAGRRSMLPKLKSAPAGVRRIAARCLEPAPEDRYQTARELAADLARGAGAFRLRRGAKRAAVAAALVAAAAAGVILWRSETRPVAAVAGAENAESAPAAARIAVLPFENPTGDEELDWVRRGLPQTLSDGLAESPGLHPIESLRVFRTIDALRLGDGALDAGAARQIASLLDVAHIVSGRIIGEEGSRRIELAVASAPAGSERRISVAVGEKGMLAAADEGVRELLSALRARKAANAPAVALSANPAAMAAYDEGVALLARGESLAAVEPLERSAAADPSFGAGWSALSRAYLETGKRDEALYAAERAVAVLGAHEGRAGLMARAQHAVLSADPDTGLKLLKEAVERYPNDDVARVRLAEQQGHFGQYKDAIENLKVVVAADSNHPRAWYLLGRYSVLSGDARAAADDYLVRALVIQNRIGDAQGRGEVVNAMGLAHERLGELDVARRHFLNAAELRDEAGDKRGLARSLANIARLDMIAGDFAAARRELSRSLDEMTKAGDLSGVADLRNEFGVLEEEAGDYRAALGHYREALRLKRDLGGEGGLAESYVNLAFTYLFLGEFDSAAAFGRDARAEYAAAGDAHGEMTVLEIEAELAIARGDWADASRAYVKELEMSRSLDAPFSEAVAEGGLGLVALQEGRPKAALEGNQRALDILGPLGDQRGINEFRLRRAAILLAIGAAAQASRELQLISAIESEGNLGQQAEYYRLQGSIAAINGSADASQAAFARASGLAQKSGSEVLKLKTDLARLRHAPADGDPAELVERAARLSHAPMRLEALELLATRRLQAKDFAGAAAAARQGLRPPARIEAWIDNWRLNALLWRALRRSSNDSAEALKAREASAAQLASLVAATPPEFRDGLAARFAEGESADVP